MPGSRATTRLPRLRPAAAAPTAAALASREQLEVWQRELPGGARREAVANAEFARTQARLRSLDARELDALRELIQANELSEASSGHDLDDGDGRFEPWELGFQIWEHGHLVLLALGPDPYASYGYALRALPEAVAAFERLELLDLSGGELRQLPDALGRLSQLRELRLAHNQLEALPESLGELLQLERLVLSANRIEALPRSLRGLEQLEELWLADNPLAELPAELLELPALRQLDVSQSLGAAQLPPERGLRELPEIARAARLEALYVAGNRLCGAAASPARFDDSARALRGLGLQRCES